MERRPSTASRETCSQGEGPKIKEAEVLSSSRKKQGKPKALEKGTAGQTKQVKPVEADQRAELFPAREE